MYSVMDNVLLVYHHPEVVMNVIDKSCKSKEDPANNKPYGKPTWCLEAYIGEYQVIGRLLSLFSPV